MHITLLFSANRTAEKRSAVYEAMSVQFDVHPFARTSLHQCNNKFGARLSIRMSVYSSANGLVTSRDEKKKKVFHFLRHGQTVMNAYLAQCDHAYGTEQFRDPHLFDTELTTFGVKQAKKAAKEITIFLSPNPEVIISSPLRRALDTADIAFAEGQCPRIAHHLAAECLWLSSDVGTPRTQLVLKYPHWSFESINEELWWYTGGHSDPRAIVPESSGRFLTRMELLRDYLLQRPENCIAFVAHAGVLKALTGEHFHNCSLKTLSEDELKVHVHAAFLV